MHPILLSSLVAVASFAPRSHATDVPHVHSSGLRATAGELAATGSFSQTGITSLQVQTAGPITILDQSSFGVVDGTLSGSFQDDLMVVILPNGRFSTTFTLTVDCTVDGKQGVLTLQASDVGQIAGSSTAHFAGVAAIAGATAELAGLHGVLEIEGVVDLASGLSTYTYEGTLRTTW